MNHRTPSRRFPAWACVVSLALLAGCASGPDIRSDYDPTVDFSEYRTYGFFQPLGLEGQGYESIIGNMFREALSREMEARGYTRSDNPDLMLNVSARLQDKTKVTTYNDPYPMGGYYGYRRGFYDPWYGYGFNTTTHVSQYTEGTVNIDMVDADEKRMVWEGVAVGRVREGRTNAELREAISKGVAEMFATYPFRAAGG